MKINDNLEKMCNEYIEKILEDDREFLHFMLKVAEKKISVGCDYMHMIPKERIKRKALELWNEFQEAEMSYADFLETQEYIINLFSDIN